MFEYSPEYEVKLPQDYEDLPDRKFAGVSLRRLIRWLETQDPETQYDYCNPYTCVTAQFLQSEGYSEIDSAVALHKRCWLQRVAQGVTFEEAANSEWSFGAALHRARLELNKLQTVLQK